MAGAYRDESDLMWEAMLANVAEYHREMCGIFFLNTRTRPSLLVLAVVGTTRNVSGNVASWSPSARAVPAGAIAGGATTTTRAAK